MASSNALTYVLLGGAAYVAWTWYKSQPATTSSGGATAPTIPTSVYDAASLAAFITAQRAAGQTDAQIQTALNAMATAQAACKTPSVWNTTTGACKTQTSTPASLSSLLSAAAGNAGQFGLDIDQWLYYYNQLPGRTPVTGDQLDQMLAKAGVTRSSPQSVDFFVGMLNSVGLSGFGGVGYGRRFIPVPRLMVVRPGGRYGLADLRRAGGR